MLGTIPHTLTDLALSRAIEAQYDSVDATVYLSISSLIEAGLEDRFSLSESKSYDAEEVYVVAVDEILELRKQNQHDKIPILQSIKGAAREALEMQIKHFITMIEQDGPLNDTRDLVYDVSEMQTLLLHGTDCEILEAGTDSQTRIGYPGRLNFQTYECFYIGDRKWEITNEDVIYRKYIIKPVANCVELVSNIGRTLEEGLMAAPNRHELACAGPLTSLQLHRIFHWREQISEDVPEPGSLPEPLP